MEELDWGDGDYARTAAVLEPAAARALDRAGVLAGDWVLDVACGTGNAALIAAERGASVVGVDAAAGLIDIARARAHAQLGGRGVDVTFVVGDAGSLPVETGTFDVAVSVFGVIFAPDPARAVGQMLDALRPGGRLVITSWLGEGPIDAVGRLLRSAMPAPPDAAPPRWDDPAWVAGLAEEAGARGVSQERATLRVEAESPAAWFAEQEEFHPVWRWARRILPAERWETLRAEAVAALAAGSSDPERFVCDSPWLLTAAAR